MYNVVVTTQDGEVIPSSLPIKKEKALRIVELLRNDPKVKEAYLSPSINDVDSLLSDLDQFILDNTL